MNKQSKQFNYEKIWSQAFLDYINQKNNTDYIAIENDNKETPNLSDVDVKAVSESKKFPTLYLQLTRDDRYERTFKNGKYSAPVFNCDNVTSAISEKVDKYTKSRKDFSQIVLLVQGTLSEGSALFIFTEEFYKQVKNYPFKAIYYLSAPRSVSYGGVIYKEGWLMKELKALMLQTPEKGQNNTLKYNQ